MSLTFVLANSITYLHLTAHATEVLRSTSRLLLVVVVGLLTLLVALDILATVSNSLANRSANIVRMVLKLRVTLKLRRSENARGSLERLGIHARKDTGQIVLAERALASLETSGLDAGGLVGRDGEGLEGGDVGKSGFGGVDVGGLDDGGGVVRGDDGGEVAHACDGAGGARAGGELLLHVGLGVGLGALSGGELGFGCVAGVAGAVHGVASGVTGLDVGLGGILEGGGESGLVGGLGRLEAGRGDCETGGAGGDAAVAGREDGLAVADVRDSGHSCGVGWDVGGLGWDGCGDLVWLAERLLGDCL